MGAYYAGVVALLGRLHPGGLESRRPEAWRPGGKDDEAEDEGADE